MCSFAQRREAGGLPRAGLHISASTCPGLPPSHKPTLAGWQPHGIFQPRALSALSFHPKEFYFIHRAATLDWPLVLALETPHCPKVHRCAGGGVGVEKGDKAFKRPAPTTYTVSTPLSTSRQPASHLKGNLWLLSQILKVRIQAGG